VFDGRVTGEPLANAELELIFHLLEQVGLALRNIWLHNQIAGNNEMMTDVLREIVDHKRIEVDRAKSAIPARELERRVADAPPVRQLAEAGASRISVGGAFAFAALGALVSAATELRDEGTYGYLEETAVGRRAVLRAFG